MGGVVAASLLVWRGHLWAALAVLLAVGGVLQAKAVSPAFAHRFERVLGRVAHTVAHGVGLALSWALLSLVFVAVIVPVWVLGFPFRRRGLGRPRGVDGDGWVERATAPAPARRTYAHERGFADAGGPVAPDPAPAAASEPTAAVGRRTTRRHPVLAALGVVMVLLLVDLALGAVLTGTGVAPGDRGGVARARADAVRSTMDAPALATSPWAEEFGEELLAFQSRAPRYHPFLVTGSSEFHGRFLNTEDWGRHSYEPAPPSDGEPLHVAFFGGSTVFGIGQRDEHTIASEFARIAESHGVPVQVRNHGYPARVAWQDMQVFERALAVEEPIDIAVFFQGFNEVLVQQTEFSRDPTHVGASNFQALSSEFHDDYGVTPGFSDTLLDLAREYRSASGVARIIDRTFDTAPDPPWLPEPSIESPQAKADAALAIYERALRLTRLLAAEAGVETSFYWQPQLAGWPQQLTDRLPDNVTDLSDVFAGREQDLYIDEVHTNEEGARLVAEAIWADIGPDLVAAAADTTAATEDGPTG